MKNQNEVDGGNKPTNGQQTPGNLKTRNPGNWRNGALVVLFTLGLFCPQAIRAQYDPNPYDPQTKTGDMGCKFLSAVTSDGGVISSVSDEATQVGIDILDAGGNAMDAAVATVFALGVTRPDWAGIGGSGSLVYRSATGELAALDFRPPAPQTMTAHSFDDLPKYRLENVLPDRRTPRWIGHLSVGVPTVVAAMAAAVERYGSGKFTLGDLIGSGDLTHPRAYELANDGAKVTFGTSNVLVYKESCRIFVIDNTPGSKMKQPDLAKSLAMIGTFGPDAFYKDTLYPGFLFKGHDYDSANTSPHIPSIGKLIVYDMANAATDSDKTEAFRAVWAAEGAKDGGGLTSGDRGLITPNDLENYVAKYRDGSLWVDPVVTTYRGHEIVGMPAPFSGGAFIAEMLNILEDYPLGSNGNFRDKGPRDFRFGRTDYIHVLAEAEKLAWADHLAYIADPAFLDQAHQDALKEIVTKSYAKQRREKIDLDHANTNPIAAGEPGKHTNHLSVIDKDGNAVAVTTTQNIPFGSGVTVPGTGIVLNNELADFTFTNPSSGNINEPNGGKKPRSHHSPTIVIKDCRPALVTGAAGGPTIPMGVLQDILNIVDFNLDLDEAIDAKRIEGGVFEYYWDPNLQMDVLTQPSDLFMEAVRFDEGVISQLKARGHTIHGFDPQGSAPVDPCYGSSEQAYFTLPLLGTARFNFTTGKNEAVNDPRLDSLSAKGQSGVTGTNPSCVQPDLIVAEVRTSSNQAPQGDKVTLTAVVANLGSEQTAGPSKTEFRIDGATVLGLVDTPTIPAGGTANVSVSHFRTAGLKGSHTIMATADVANAVAESNEANNSTTTTVVLKGNRVLP